MTDETAFDEAEMAIVRRAFARQMLAIVQVAGDARLEDAFAAVPRERFLGPAPWRAVAHGGGYSALASRDPVMAYQDLIFALAPQRGVNNGSPSLHAWWLHKAALAPGALVAHIGAGTGYYTALMAHLVGPDGHVLAVEFDPALAALASRNLAHLPNVTVVDGDGGDWPPEPVDCVYVNFSVQRPADAWVEQLNTGGRLIFPLGVPRPQRGSTGGVHALHGAGFQVERLAGGGLAARWLGPAFFVCAEGPLAASTPETEPLKAAFERGGAEFVRSLIWKQPVSTERCWFAGAGWALSYDQPA